MDWQPGGSGNSFNCNRLNMNDLLNDIKVVRKSPTRSYQIGGLQKNWYKIG